ncbi:MAG: tRNA (adenosine(37)-N6)-threonylcarbamoyltransferase complex dimerization subunit type 1 TsaB [Polyangiaceae bacterium UTPRO1]|jgi:tRNA threonylcarbamoyladenosine biosynthesis protein TsaB|nr:tRNA (adenosine(37)-N6)-threonylcarbamoyltransferase complex dimerization subunit type 1 TsaB [Myxococcales bacterium]OQY68690.1 MAG: tRNA (adenosine(37)-N6)-threonylcarbamoyltransferase complex dimerization subunit type 1 TsaB [Polyangiaceae bacterium UTPRO1]
MRILALDTATRRCAVALVRGDAVVAERYERAAANHAGLLPRLVAETLEEGGRLAAGDAIAVAIGPGSFTGLRIGLGFAKGMAVAGGYRLVGVPTLDALALAAPVGETRVCAVLDARKREVYAALYERDAEGLHRRGIPCAIDAERLAVAVGAPCTFVGDGVDVYGDVFRRVLGAGATVLSPVTHPPGAAALARLAAARLRTEPRGDDLASLAPAYVRPPEAELSQSAYAPSAGLEVRSFVDKARIV